MSEHLGQIELKNYGESNLSPREFLRVQAHLETCEDCTRRLDEMFPNIVEHEEALLLEDLADETLREFHLNYDEHLKPFIYQTIDAVEREIVESHVEVCADCREDLRDLLQFHEELEREKEIRELSKPRFWTQVSEWFSAPNRKAVWLAFACVLIFVSAGLVWFFVSRPVSEIVQNQANADKTRTNQITPITNQTPFETNQNQQASKSNANLPNANPAENQNTNETPKEIEMAALVLPKFLDELQINENETIRGNNNMRGENVLPKQKITVIAPNGKVIRDASPVLSWNGLPSVESFDVKVFDNNNPPNKIAEIKNLKGYSWRVPNLTKGKIYQWQVTATTVTADGKTQNYLGQGKFYIVSQQDENKINGAKNSLERGKVLAEAGLLREAAAEFRRFLKENPNSENAKKFLRQIQQAQR
jgi:hypothetical protein